jgi:tetratricopeptide (TPR) repeat protein
MTRAFEKKTLVIAVSVALFAILAVLAAFAFRPVAKIALSAPELLDLGEKYLLELNYEQAIIQFQLAIDIEPRNVRAILGIADAYLHLGQQDQAIAALSTGFEASGNENLSHALEGVRKSVIEGYIAIAEAYEAEGLHDRALEILRRVFEETGDESIGMHLKSLESDTNDPSEGDAESEGVTETEEPLSVSELLGLGEKFLVDRNYDQAAIQFALAIEIEPGNFLALLGIADAYLHLGQQDQAASALSTGFEASGSEKLSHALEGVRKSAIDGYIAIAEAYEAEGFHDRAIEILRRVFEETCDEIIGRKLKILESALVTFREDYEIQWKDPEFERLIREYLGNPSGGVRYDDVKLIEEIDIWGEVINKTGEGFWLGYSRNGFNVKSEPEGRRTGKIRSLEDLEHFTSLKLLGVNFQEDLSLEALSDIENIDCLKRLQSIDLISSNITDISALSGLFAIERIKLQYNNITDISPISMLTELTEINISNNQQLMSSEPLRGMRKLYSAYIGGIDTVDLNVFVGMPELKSLSIVALVSNKNIDFSILKKLSLQHIEVTCDESNFPFITEMDTLTSLRLHGNALTSISGIESLSNLKRLELLARICTDISPLASLNVDFLLLEVGEDCDLTPLAKMPNLKTLRITSSQLDRAQALLPGIEVNPI